MPDTLLVTGATGHLGQRVLHHLVDTLRVPGNRIIATTRKPESLSAWAVKGVVVRTADFENTASLTDAFRGARRLLLISTDAIDRPGRRLAQHKNAIDAAVQAGVSHVVYTSMPEPEGSPVVFAPDHAGTEAALAASTLPGWTVLRNRATTSGARPPVCWPAPTRVRTPSRSAALRPCRLPSRQQPSRK